MRHYFAARPVATLSRSMAASPRRTVLVGLSGAPKRAAPGPLGAVFGTIDLAAVAAAADQRLNPAARAEKIRADAASAWDAIKPGGRTPRLPGYWPSMRAQHGVGHGVEPNRQVQISAPCLPFDTGKPTPGQPAALLIGGKRVDQRAATIPSIPDTRFIYIEPQKADVTSGRQTSRAG
jgi:hypothetical protein